MIAVTFLETLATYFQILFLSSCGSFGKRIKVSRRGSGEVARAGRLRQST
jgi:hypothetical protein